MQSTKTFGVSKRRAACDVAASLDDSVSWDDVACVDAYSNLHTLVRRILIFSHAHLPA